MLPPYLHPTRGILQDAADGSSPQPASSPGSLQASPVKAPHAQPNEAAPAVASDAGLIPAQPQADTTPLQEPDEGEASPATAAGLEGAASRAAAPPDRGEGAEGSVHSVAESGNRSAAAGVTGELEQSKQAVEEAMPGSSTARVAQQPAGLGRQGGADSAGGAALSPVPALRLAPDAATEGSPAPEPQAGSPERDGAPHGALEQRLPDQGPSGSEAHRLPDQEPSGSEAHRLPDQEPSGSPAASPRDLQLDDRSESAALAAVHHEPPPLATEQPLVPVPGQLQGGVPSMDGAAAESRIENGAAETAAPGVPAPGYGSSAPVEAEPGQPGDAAGDRAKPLWLLFNDFAVAPTAAAEVTQLYGLQKIPCLLFYTQVGHLLGFLLRGRAWALHHGIANVQSFKEGRVHSVGFTTEASDISSATFRWRASRRPAARRRRGRCPCSALARSGRCAPRHPCRHGPFVPSSAEASTHTYADCRVAHGATYPVIQHACRLPTIHGVRTCQVYTCMQSL